MNKQVADRLEVARKDHATYLDLTSCSLTEIPEAVFALPDLEVLYLTDNQLRNVPEGLRDLQHLRIVYLDDNPLESLPDLPGLYIDAQTYFHLRPGIDKKNIAGLSIGADAPEAGKDFWPAELMTLATLA